MYFLFIFGILVFSIALIFLIDKNSSFLLRFVSSSSTGLVLVLSCLLMAKFDDNLYHYQYLTTYEFDTNIFNISFSFGLDGLSVIFIFLSSLLIFLTILFIWQDSFFKEYCLSLLIIEIFLYLIFSTLDLFIFYVFFEAILIPMYLVIGIWGSRQRKIRAVYLFFFYTLCGSIFMLVGILYIFSVVGTLNLEYLILHKFDTKEQILLWLAFFVSFSSKIPLFPFHIWLPEAHVEAPTVGSVLLAGILLKLGVYGFLRFSLILFPEGSQYFSPLVYLLSITGVLYASFTAIRQTDLKRVIAYSSVAHMNLVTLGIFSFNSLGIEGAILQSVSHGFVSGGLFFFNWYTLQ
jgi:NADH-quinone oxidoreductase subunit M